MVVSSTLVRASMVAPLSALVLLSMTAGCGKAKSEQKKAQESVKELTEGSNIEIAGSLALDGAGLNLAESVDLASLKVYCVTFQTPPVAGEGAVGANGAFKLTLAGAQAAVGCFVLKGTEQLATLVFQDPNDTGMDGSSKETSRNAFATSANLGEIKLNPKTGKAVANVNNFKDKIKKASLNAQSAFDFSGAWKIAAPEFKLPEGYKATCPEGSDERLCEGPIAGMTINFKRIVGKKFTPDQACIDAVKAGTSVTECNGTTGSEDEFIISGWESDEQFAACGSRLGFSYNEGKAFGRIDLSGSGIAEGQYTWASGFVDGWKNPQAVSNWSMHDCSDIDYQGIEVSQCKGTFANTGAGYVLHTKGGGCVDAASGAPVRIDQWNDIVWKQDGHTTTQDSPAVGLRTSVSFATYKGIELKCTHVNGEFAENGTPHTTWPGNFTHNSFMNQGQLCSSLENDGDPAKRLAALRCYANDFYNNGGRGGGDGGSGPAKCTRQLRTDWSAKDPSDFLMDGHGPAKANAQFMMEKVVYTDANTVSFRTEEVDNRGIQSKDGFVDCKLQRSEVVTLKKLAENKLMAEIVTDKVLIDTEKPVCVSETQENGQLEVGRSKEMFFLVK